MNWGRSLWSRVLDTQRFLNRVDVRQYRRATVLVKHVCGPSNGLVLHWVPRRCQTTCVSESGVCSIVPDGHSGTGWRAPT